MKSMGCRSADAGECFAKQMVGCPYKIAGNDHKYAHRMCISNQPAYTSVILSEATKPSRVDLDRGKKPRARYVYAKLFSASS